MSDRVEARKNEDRESSDLYARYVLVVLALVYVTNHIDRQILMVLLEAIKTEFGASDLQMGLLTGPAFALFYTFAGIPIARWADRGPRKLIIVLASAMWSAMTALSGTARSFASLAVFRVGVGVGEAGCSPPAHSLISDYFPPHQRGRAMSIYGAGTQIGAAFGYLLGGWLLVSLGWRNTFVAVGVPGVLLSLLVWATIREPMRGAAESGEPPPSAERGTALRADLAMLWRNRTYTWLQVGAALHAVAGYGLGVWTVPFLIRVHEMEVQVIGTALGLIGLGVGIPGIVLGGYLCDQLSARDPRWYLWIPTLGAVIGIPFTVGFLFLPEPRLALAAYSVHSMMNMAYIAPVFALMQGTVPLRLRSLAVAVHLFIANLIGLGLGPVLVGGLSDWLQPRYGLQAIRYTMLLAAITNVVACVFYLRSARTVEDDLISR